MGLEEAVRDTWLESFRERNPDVDDTTAARLWKDLRAALGKLVNSRSAEAATFLYIDREEARTQFEEILNESRALSDILEGSAGASPELVRSEFVRLIHAPKGQQAEFLLDALNAAFQYHLISLDPGAARLARSVVGSRVFYLDTNFLFRLLALHGPREAHGPALIANLASELSTELRVGRATLKEFKATVRYRSKELRRSLLQREDFRRIAADHATTDLDFMTEFYRQLQSGHVRGVDDFEGKYYQIEHALDDWGIVIDEGCTWDDEVIASLTDRSRQLTSWSSGDKGQSSCNHDVLMEHYVREARKAEFGGLKDVDVWFLTYDRRLTRFAFGNPIDGEVPVPLLAEDWLQIVRCFSPRTEEYDRAFLALLSSPLLGEHQAVPFGHVVTAPNRLERYEGLSANVVAAMVVEQEFVKQLSEPLTEQEERKVVELAVARVTSRIEAELDQTRSRARLAESERDLALREWDESESALDRMRLQHKKARGAVTRTKDEGRRLKKEVVGLRVALTAVIATVLVLIVVWLWTPALLGGATRWRMFLVVCAGAIQAFATSVIWGRKGLGMILGCVALGVALLQFLVGGT